MDPPASRRSSAVHSHLHRCPHSHHHFHHICLHHHHNHHQFAPHHHHHHLCQQHSVSTAESQLPATDDPPLNRNDETTFLYSASGPVEEVLMEQEVADEDGEELYDDDPVFVMTDEWKEFFAKSEARRRLEKQQTKNNEKQKNKAG